MAERFCYDVQIWFHGLRKFVTDSGKFPEGAAKWSHSPVNGLYRTRCYTGFPRRFPRSSSAKWCIKLPESRHRCQAPLQQF
jgi:hypothetical protein